MAREDREGSAVETELVKKPLTLCSILPKDFRGEPCFSRKGDLTVIMVGWTGVIGKTINFVLEKIAGKKLDLLLDDCRKAARQFCQLYLAVSDLEVLCKELIVELREMATANDPTVSAEWLRDVSMAIDETSERFLEATQGLTEVLEIFDPVLAQTVSGLEANKFSFPLIAANGFEPQIANDQIQAVKYPSPRTQLDELDFAGTYQWHADHRQLDYSRPIEWPNDVLINFLDESHLEEGRLTLAEPESMNRLADLVEKHNAFLSAAREGLALFLRQNFKMEDLLALQVPMTRFDRIHAMHRMSDAVRISYLRFFAGKPVRSIRAPRKAEGTDKTEAGGD